MRPPDGAGRAGDDEPAARLGEPKWRIVHGGREVPAERPSESETSGELTNAPWAETTERWDEVPEELPSRAEETRPPLITFLTDFGLAWGPVGVCHAVIKDIAPQADVIDLSHSIPAFDVRAGAWVLAASLPYVPIGTHVAVVDPGVGTHRLALVLRCERGDLLVGPNNGLLLPAANRLGGVVDARSITNEDVMRHPVSATFHGRDVFAPVAAHLASGLPLAEVGSRLEIDQLVQSPWKVPEYAERRASGEAVLLDSFGSVRTNVETARWPLTPGGRLYVTTPTGGTQMSVARTFGDVGRGELFALDDSSGYVCLATNLGSAARALQVSPGDALTFERL